MRIDQDIKLDFDDVLIRPKRSTLTSRAEVVLEREFHFKHSPLEWRGIPFISANMTSVTTPAVVEEMYRHNMLACLPKRIISQDAIQSLGLNDCLPMFSRFICLDAPNGYIEVFVEKLVKLREVHPTATLIAGNVVTPEMVEELILAGADIVKVGLGSGVACLTRSQTGIGYPQLSAVIECADAAHGLEGHIISDGGCHTHGDIVKAFAAGADFVMLGATLANCDENRGTFYGSASRRAIEESAGGLKTYRAVEGREMELPPKGPLANVLQEITGGLRSACAYVGARTLKELPKRATFIRVTR